jgi:hypothetical protein
MTKPKQQTFAVNFRISLDIGFEIKAESFQDAVTYAHADLGDISYNTWQCKSCYGTGLKRPGEDIVDRLIYNSTSEDAELVSLVEDSAEAAAVIIALRKKLKVQET